VSAYNNVDHAILLKILRERIADKKFLRLIKDLLKSGVMDNNKFEHSLNGIPQRGIVSPLLFNIYMLGFDQYVYEEFIVPILKENERKPKRERPSSEYNKAKYLTEKALKNLKKFKKNIVTKTNVTKVKELLKEFKRVRALRNNISYAKIEELRRGIVYVRYADDWVLAITCTKSKAQEMKKKVSEFLKKKRKMDLDLEKTKITQASDGYKFLGFEIRLDTRKPKLMRVLQKDRNGIYSRPLKRTTSRRITIEPDKNRLLKRLKRLKMCRKNNAFPIGKPIWTVYDEFQIVQKYNQIFREIFNYYAPCEKLARLYQISYILQYSCAKTIALKKKISISKVFKLYRKNLKINTTIQGAKKDNQRSVEFFNIVALKKLNQNKKPSKNLVSESRDPF
jgi:hypothetical protein